jgi:hypothetical protein
MPEARFQQKPETLGLAMYKLYSLSLFNFDLNNHQAALQLTGQASRIAIQLGLNRCSPTSCQP